MVQSRRCFESDSQEYCKLIRTLFFITMKISIGKFVLIAVSLISFNAAAQKTEGGIALNAGAGLSMFGILGSINLNIPDEVKIESNSTPCWTGALDFGMQNKFSIGLGGGYQSYDQTVTDYQYVDENGEEKIGEFSYSLTRINAGIRILYHYGNGKVDAYSGIKPGVNIFQFETSTNLPLPGWVRLSGSVFAFQVIPIGFRAYLNNHIGIFFETGIGAPSFVSGGLTIGFEKQATQ
jgi:hypothetical protein